MFKKIALFLLLSTIPACELNNSGMIDSPDASAPDTQAPDTQAQDTQVPDSLPQGSCGPDYHLGQFGNPGIWCVPNDGNADKNYACANGHPVGWAGQGIVRCAE